MSKIQIAVVDSGWVLVGECSAGTKVVTLTDASVIRIWGTTKGLGEIALGGPTKTTQLDKVGTVFIERSSLKFLIECEDTKWRK